MRVLRYLLHCGFPKSPDSLRYSALLSASFDALIFGSSGRWLLSFVGRDCSDC
jgi:hypothetical protein